MTLSLTVAFLKKMTSSSLSSEMTTSLRLRGLSPLWHRLSNDLLKREVEAGRHVESGVSWVRMRQMTYF